MPIQEIAQRVRHAHHPNLRKDLGPIAHKAGYPGSFHSLRHVFATIAASSVSLAALSKVLGHRRVSTTSDLYAHLYDPDAAMAVDAVDTAFGELAKKNKAAGG